MKRELTQIEKLSNIYSQLESSGKILPRSEESERYVLGAMLSDKFCVNVAFEIIGIPEQGDVPFYSEQHRTLFTVCKNIFLSGEMPDLVKVCEYVTERSLKEVLPILWLVELIKLSIHTSYIADHCKRLLRFQQRRALILHTEYISAEGRAGQKPTDELLEEADLGIIRIRETKKTTDPKPIGEIEYDNQNQFKTGIKTGLKKIDELLHRGVGAQAGDYIIIAARPSCGKTTFGINIAANEAMQGNASLFFSLEMTTEKIAGKFFEYYTGIPIWKLDKQRYPNVMFTAEQQKELSEYLKKKKDLKCFVDDSTNNPLAMRGQISRWKRKHDIKAVFIDYLQLVHPIQRQQMREREISEISATVKAMAKEFEIPFFLLCQLNRAMFSRKSAKPQLSDLRESGSLEQDADIVLFLNDPIMATTGNQEELREVEIFAAKNRLGALGFSHTQFDTTRSLFSEKEFTEQTERAIEEQKKVIIETEEKPAF